jgi:DNA-binding CsgD family transcriptional regulator
MSEFQEVVSFPLHLEIPINQAIRHDEIVQVNSVQEMKDRFPRVTRYHESVDGWKTSIAWPINSHGGAFVFFNKEIQMNSQVENFLRSIGSIAGLALRQLQEAAPSSLDSHVDPRAARKAKNDLSERQTVIIGLLQKGLTNREIAAELGFSESLIRQETVSIYRILRIGSRKEIPMALQNQ